MFLAFQPHLYEQQRKVERQQVATKKATPTSSSSTLINAPSLSPPSSSSTTPSHSHPSSMLDTKREDEITAGLVPFKSTSPSPSLFSRRKGRTRAATQSTEESPLNRKQSNTALKSDTSKKLLRGRTARPSSARPSSSGSGLDENKGFNGRFFSIIPPLIGNTFNTTAPPAVIDETPGTPPSEAIFKRHQKKDSSSSGMHVSVSLSSGYEQSKSSPGSQPSSARPAALDGLGISHYLDAFPLPEEEPQDLSHYPLPIRLGLIRLGQIPRSARKKLHRANKAYPSIEPPAAPYKKKVSPQYCQGYYLCTPPPADKEEKSMTNPESHNVEASLSSSRRGGSPRRSQVGNRERSMSDAGEGREMSRRPSNRGDNIRRWKLEQYFHSYSRKTWKGTKSYKFSAYDREEACYWYGYSVKTLMVEMLSHSILNAAAGLTVLDWSKDTPSRVLDIGTGTGVWVLDAAKKWTEAEFIGLDLVPIQTPLNHLPDEDLSSRISWVVANALHALPFPDNSFDYIHIRWINTGIPEEKWGDLLSEVIRVLTPNGNLEILETDWTFMGTPKEILTSDLQELVGGKGRANQGKMKMWKHREVRQFDNLGIAINSMHKTRQVKFDPCSIIPFFLMTLDVQQFRQGQPRHYPILAYSSKHQAEKKKEIFDDGDDDDDKENKKAPQNTKLWSPQGPSGAKSLTMRPQIGLPLPPHRFQIDNQDANRMGIMVTDTTRISEARDLIWEDLQRGSKGGDVINGPWKHKGEFEKEMDDWHDDLMNRADLKNLLKSTFDWNEAATRMDTRIRQDRQNRIEKKRRAAPLLDHHFLSEDEIVPVVDLDYSIPNEERRLSEASDGGEDEDQSTVNDHEPEDIPFALTTPILGFRTTTVIVTKKKQ